MHLYAKRSTSDRPFADSFHGLIQLLHEPAPKNLLDLLLRLAPGRDCLFQKLGEEKVSGTVLETVPDTFLTPFLPHGIEKQPPPRPFRRPGQQVSLRRLWIGCREMRSRREPYDRCQGQCGSSSKPIHKNAPLQNMFLGDGMW
jgi:hypothetical protein